MGCHVQRFEHLKEVTWCSENMDNWVKSLLTSVLNCNSGEVKDLS